MDAAHTLVANRIREAFRGVVLGRGVGLWQGQGLDDYADASTLAAYRARDEQTDWSAIPVSELNRCHSSLSFFDAEGMRFHLPCFLLAELEGALLNGVLFHLVTIDDYARGRFALLSEAQRQAVRAFLLLCASDPEFAFERPEIEQALKDYWVGA